MGARAAEAFASLAVLHDIPSIASPVLIDHHTLEFEKFHFQAVLEGEIQRIVMFFQSNKVPGHDKVPMSVIKDALPWILPALTDIVNHSLLFSVFPASWKISEVVLLPKDGDHELANNNRPVSLLPAMSERAALNQFIAYMKSMQPKFNWTSLKMGIKLDIQLNDECYDDRQVSGTGGQDLSIV